MAGYYHDRKADDVHDDLFAHALVLSQGDASAAIVVCDLIGLERQLTLQARALIEQRTGIPAGNIMICCTHTHTGPVVSSKRSRIMSPDEVYTQVLVRKLADSVQLAYQRREKALLQVGTGHVEGIAFNRRYWMKDGTLRTNPPFQCPDIVRPAGPVDPQVGILRARKADGGTLALLTNYALHADEVGGTAFCADYQGVVSRLLKQVLGPGCAVLCANGCCGDINHFDMAKPAPQSGFFAAERSGTVLAGEVVKRLPDLAPVPAGRFTAASATFEAGLRLPTDEEVAWAQGVVGQELHGFDDQGLNVVKAHRILWLRESGLTHMPIEVSVITLGEMALVGLPGEIFVELGLAIKEQSPFPHTFVAELCNDSIGYVPTRKAYGEGGYEATSTPLEMGTGERMVEVALELLRQAR
ncbi:MAG: neutral/alkaline non-lysosomal ceramidase N-terminal domain-containing protein, partial [Anaerolineae bacterium]